MQAGTRSTGHHRLWRLEGIVPGQHKPVEFVTEIVLLSVFQVRTELSAERMASLR